MMRTMRSIAPWIMAIVAVSFVGWMVFEVGMDVRGQTTGAPLDEVGRVNGQKIDAQTFYAAVRQTQETQRQQGAPPTTTLEEQRQLEDQVLEQIVQQILLDDEYRRQEITVTDDELRQALRFAPLPELREVEIFQTEGQFDLEKYQRYLLSGADPNFALALEQRYREELPRIKYFERIAQGANVSGAKLWQVYRDQNDSVTATVVALVPAVLVPDDARPIRPRRWSARGPFARRSSPAPTSRPWPPASPPTRPTGTRAAISARSSAVPSCPRSRRPRWRYGRDNCRSPC
jgi:peptidyl-prolyl cis-trans isomerase D